MNIIGCLWFFVAHANPQVQLGSNPVRSFAGDVAGNNTLSLFTVPSTEDFVITDVLFSSSSYTCYGSYQLQNSSGTILGAFRMQARSDTYDFATSTAIVQHSFRSGIRIPAGTILHLVHNTTCDTAYVIAGQLVKP